MLQGAINTIEGRQYPVPVLARREWGIAKTVSVLGNFALLKPKVPGYCFRYIRLGPVWRFNVDRRRRERSFERVKEFEQYDTKCKCIKRGVYREQRTIQRQAKNGQYWKYQK